MTEEKKMTIRVDKSVVKQLHLIKLENDLKSVSDAIKLLLESKK